MKINSSNVIRKWKKIRLKLFTLNKDWFALKNSSLKYIHIRIKYISAWILLQINIFSSNLRSNEWNILIFSALPQRNHQMFNVLLHSGSGFGKKWRLADLHHVRWNNISSIPVLTHVSKHQHHFACISNSVKVWREPFSMLICSRKTPAQYCRWNNCLYNLFN